MWEDFIFINSLINLELETSKKVILVLLVMVPVTRAPFAFGGLTSSIFPGTPVFRLAKCPGAPKKLITLISLVPVLLILVILLKATPLPLFLIQIPVPSPLTDSVFRGLLSFCVKKNCYIVTKTTGGTI